MARRFHFGYAQVRRVMDDLALQIGQFHNIRVGDADHPHPGSRQVKSGWRAKRPGTDDENLVLKETPLSLAADLFEDL